MSDPVLKRDPRILIVRTDRLGDVVLTLPMASAIKSNFPTASVVMMVRVYTYPIVERATDVDDILLFDAALSFRRLIKLFRSAKADFVYFPNPRFRLAAAARLAGIHSRVGTAYRWYSFLFSEKIREHRKTAEFHEADYNLRMLRSLGIRPVKGLTANIHLRDPERLAVNRWITSEIGNTEIGNEEVRNAKIMDGKRFVVLHAVSGGSGQEWPADRFATLARELIDQFSMDVVLTGTPSDSEKLLRIQSETARKEHVQLFIGHPLEELAALLEKATVVVSSGTGPGHLSAALSTPTIGLFPLVKVISKERWGMRGSKAINISPEPLPDSERDHGCPNCSVCTCMERITVETVRTAILSQMDVE